MVTIETATLQKNLIFYTLKEQGMNFKAFCKKHKLTYQRCYGFLHRGYPLKYKSGSRTGTYKEIKKLIEVLNKEFPNL